MYLNKKKKNVQNYRNVRAITQDVRFTFFFRLSNWWGVVWGWDGGGWVCVVEVFGEGEGGFFFFVVGG